MVAPNTILGYRGEDAVRKYLESQGWTFVGKHFRTRYGEIDLIMKDGYTLVFIEVKLRRTQTFGPAEESVSSDKIRHLETAAEEYLRQHPEEEQPETRFDLAIVEPEGAMWHVRMVKDISS